MTDYKAIVMSKLPKIGDFNDVYAFSIHKAGSSLMHKMIADVSNYSKIPSVSIPDLLFKEGISDEWQSDISMSLFFERGRIYYGFRNLPKFMTGENFSLTNKKAVLLVRDPRDALVSQYYSLSGKYISHQLPQKNSEVFIERLQKTASLSIDDYVLQAAPNHLNKLKEYRLGLNFNNVLLKNYENIYYDKINFLSEIFSHFELDVDKEIILRVALQNDIRPDSEDITKHIRKGTPGDYKEKLCSTTICKLNELFKDEVKWFGYSF